MERSGLTLQEVLALCLHRITMEEGGLSSEREMVQVVKNLEAVRRRWLHAELELKKYKELLVNSDVSKAALEVKLKHARNQLDLEMRKRYKMEGDFHYLQRQMQLMCDVLLQDGRASGLNAQQRSLLATAHQQGAGSLQRSGRRLCVIDESSFLSHSDISYDRTEDDVDLDTTTLKPLRSRARERRRSSMGLPAGPAVGKRGRGGNVSAELLERKPIEEVNTLVKQLAMAPETWINVMGIAPRETRETRETEEPVCTASRESAGPVAADQTSSWFHRDEEETRAAHVFLSKTVIRPEVCLPCGKRLRFGKMAVKCRSCRCVAHPECKGQLGARCPPPAGGSARQNSLEAWAPATQPKVPLLLVECVAEIERRGLEERGLYRVPGAERLVKELRERFLQGKTAPLGKVADVHVLCGVLKDFLRTLSEPLVPFSLHQRFMQAAEPPDEDQGSAVMSQAVAQLPKVNRDTLAFLMLHLQKVMRSPRCQMDKNNLSRVFGPTIVGHGMSEPTPTTIMRDVHIQPKVISRMLSLPEAYWRRVLAGSSSQSHGLEDEHGRLFEPLTSPELSSFYKTPSRGTVRGRTRYQSHDLPRAGRAEPEPRFFTSPS